MRSLFRSTCRRRPAPRNWSAYDLFHSAGSKIVIKSRRWHRAMFRPATGIRLETKSKSAHVALILGATLTLAFSIRLGLRLAFGEDSFWSNGYSIYYMLAENIVSGNGLCFRSGFGFENNCAWLPP